MRKLEVLVVEIENNVQDDDKKKVKEYDEALDTALRRLSGLRLPHPEDILTMGGSKKGGGTRMFTRKWESNFFNSIPSSTPAVVARLKKAKRWIVARELANNFLRGIVSLQTRYISTSMADIVKSLSGIKAGPGEKPVLPWTY